MGKWISVKDRFPENDTDVLILTNYDCETNHDTPYVRQAKYKNNSWYDVDPNTEYGITHWTHIPRLPDRSK